ncbi:MAG TPA: AAA family ATPase [Chthoniobacterales bacterium]|nr:AAA family ATPase [Chthoniobacterales bacterium]
MEVSTYRLELLRENAEFVVYRGRRDIEPRQILAVAPASKNAAQGALRRLENEYSLRARLDPDWALVPLELAQEKGRTILILDDPGGQWLDGLLEGPLDLSEFLRISVRLANALAKVHERGIIHRDLKPANVMVDRISGKVWLTGFGIASDLPREHQAPDAPETVLGTLGYMAPEQTGRMNRSIDSRSDLYSLGVMLYEMLTGALPFSASDPTEWIHCHIARRPTPPAVRRTEIPEALSAIVLKLLAKAAEERYQTATGLELDLRKCLLDWESLRRIATFALGANDISDRLFIPEKLYGRDRESRALLEAFDRVAASGTPELVLVSGHAGIGKSTFVNELHRAAVLPRGIFVSGKVDEYRQDIPYATLAQALQTLISQVLSSSETEVEYWRGKIRNAVGSNGQLVVKLVPELGLIIGEQPPVPNIPLKEAQNRFAGVMRRFLSVFARREHPLVLFLDDLQWLDAGTLKLVEHLVVHPDVAYLLLIGAYRDNEVGPSHPLMLALNSIRNRGAIVHDIVLLPLSFEVVNQLIADSLRQERWRTEPLARIVNEKTGANPFFMIQFLTALVEERFLRFDAREGAWTWDLNCIRAMQIAENVVDLMVGKLNRLPIDAIEALKQLACFGSNAKAADLTVLYGGSKEVVRSGIWRAVRAGFVLQIADSFRFAHDRVQEAAYSLIPEDKRAAAHLKVGRLLLSNTASNELGDKIFEIVNQLNRGSELIGSLEERARVAELNLTAGKRAQSADAHWSALAYLSAGVALLPLEYWERQYELTFGLELRRAESEFASGYLETAAEHLSMLSHRARSLVDYAAVTCLRVDLYTTLDRSDLAVSVCLEHLSRLGVAWSPHPTEKEVLQEIEEMWRRIGSRSIESLIELPPMTDPDWCATMDVLTKVVPPAMFTDKNLQCLVLGRMANLSLEHGNCDGSCLGYVWLGGVMGATFGDYSTGFRFGKLGVDLMEKRRLSRFNSRVYLGFGSLVSPWTQHMRSGIPLMRRAFVAAQETGDLTYAAYACYDLIGQLVSSGDPLAGVEQEAENALELASKARFGLMIDGITGQLRLIRTLRGLTPEFGCFDDDQFSEIQFERHLDSNPDLTNPACRYWIRKLQARFYAGAYASAIEAAEKAGRLLWAMPPSVELPEYHFHGALARARHWDSAPPGERAEHQEALKVHYRQLETWAESCPANFESRAGLVAAEIARIEGRAFDAERHYERATQSAHENGFTQNEGIGSELAGRFYRNRGLETIGNFYLRNARSCYLRWGALGKVNQFDLLYPGFKEPAVLEPTATLGASLEQLELTTVVKALQAVSREIDLGKLIETLMVIAVECAGAERGLLFLPRAQDPEIAAEALTRDDKIQVCLTYAFTTVPEFPEAVIRYVIRTRERVILDDASVDNPYSHDDYVRTRRLRLRSVLCLPLVKLGALTGVLYLENNLAPRVFNPRRLAVLELLAGQAAISLENARLYSDLAQENCDRRKAEEALRVSEERIKLAAEAANLAMWEWDLLKDEIWMNDKGRVLFGLSRELRLNGAAISALIYPEDRLAHNAAISRALETVDGYDEEYRIVLPDGRIRWIAARGCVEFVSGKPVRIRGVSRDITERKHAELEAARQRTDMAHAARLTMVGQLTASIVHELGQPLGAILSNIETAEILLASKEVPLDMIREILGDVRKDDERASNVIRRLGALLRKRKLELGPIDLNAATSDVIRLIAGETHRQRVTIEEHFADDLPVVRGDFVHLQQVLLNLILNGMEAMSDLPESNRRLTIRTAYSGNGEVEVSVEDSGPGIPSERLPLLFDSFFTTKPHGMGLGLTIVRSILDAHGGRIAAKNISGGGACFRFTLPVAEVVRKDGLRNQAQTNY